MPESVWKCLFYLGSWTSVAYIILFKESCNYFHRPTLIWEGIVFEHKTPFKGHNRKKALIREGFFFLFPKGYSLDLEVPMDIYMIYMVQISFYVHSLYATLCIDVWRKDSLVLMAHHVITSILLIFSLSTRY